MGMSRQEKQIRKRLRDDFPHYAEKALTIRAKKALSLGGHKKKLVPFRLNKAQVYLHNRFEEIKLAEGRLRVLLLKGRQQGTSTLVGARFFHITTHNSGIKTFILTHRDDATANLFRMTKRFQDYLPQLIKPSTSYSNRKELVFDKLDSSYALGTAGSGDVGRSDTIDLLHGSEVAFWKNTEDIKTGVFQAAEAAQEIILESTANGLGNMFFEMWQDAEAGLSDYTAIFIPWFWQDEYRREVPPDFELEPEEAEYKELYGLDLEQIAWRRFKIVDLKDPVLFKQEYPACAAEAFQTTGVDSFIKPEPVIRARKARNIRQSGAHIIGVDPARGGDRTALIHQQGLVAWGLESWKTPDTTSITGRVNELMSNDSDYVDRLFIDVGGLGGPLYDVWKNMPWGKRVTPVNFGSTDCYNKERYKNRKAEMYGEARDWLENPVEQCSIPDSDSLQADCCAAGYKYDNQQRIQIESKDSLKDRGVRSNDEAEALFLTFAMPVKSVDRDRLRGRRVVRKPFAL